MFMAIMIAMVMQAKAQVAFPGFTITTDGYYRAPDGKIISSNRLKENTQDKYII